jgi:hypothetical protein
MGGDAGIVRDRAVTVWDSNQRQGQRSQLYGHLRKEKKRSN